MQLSFDVLILGAGWTSTFLIPLCKKRSLTCAATTRDGRGGTVKWAFDPDSDNERVYAALPDAKTVVITFPITKPGASERLVRLYSKTRKNSKGRVGFIQLGSTGVWDVSLHAYNGTSLANLDSRARGKALQEALLSLQSPSPINGMTGIRLLELASAQSPRRSSWGSSQSSGRRC